MIASRLLDRDQILQMVKSSGCDDLLYEQQLVDTSINLDPVKRSND